ncbi:hypothetical protein [uncultured Mucilaginibacter sp.]|uniref:hypothetical protein n=1 Tax=uncultured Mucilaginibacter sp. TaxID=797541 RepID=UPI0025D49652|nr:hypothetical protein [uncultured Mucilaginibacter sp.]
MKYIIILALFCHSFKTFAQAKSTKQYAITYSKVDTSNLYNGAIIKVKVFDALNQEYVAYGLVVNGLFLQNDSFKSSMVLRVIPKNSIKIDCMAMGFYPIKLPKFKLQKNDLATITFYLKEDLTPVQ